MVIYRFGRVADCTFHAESQKSKAFPRTTDGEPVRPDGFHAPKQPRIHNSKNKSTPDTGQKYPSESFPE